MAYGRLKVIIVGGSVAGLTLAHTLASAGIDFILLEARDNIAPQLGATIILMPNGARILDQLGVFESMESLLCEGTVQITRKSDGTLMGRNEWPSAIKERLGYAPGIFERQKFLQQLYDRLDEQSKQKVILNTKVIKIEDSPDSITVKCANGTEYIGDIVVGADGIHSKVRQEMQRHMRDGGGNEIEDENNITAEYSCIFGLSPRMPNLEPGNMICVRDLGCSSLLFVAKDLVPQWFFISKMDKLYRGSGIPRYSKSDMESIISKNKEFHLAPGVALKDVVASATQISYQALEEAYHNMWTYGRIICLGDSIHKMTPNFGQGGNQAIESVVTLTNCLLEALSESSQHTLSDSSIRTVLKKYQQLRQSRAKSFIHLSGIITRSEALDTLRYTLRFLFFPLATTELLADIQTKLYIDAPKLHHLPTPKRLAGNKFWRDIGHLEETATYKAQWVLRILN